MSALIVKAILRVVLVYVLAQVGARAITDHLPVRSTPMVAWSESPVEGDNLRSKTLLIPAFGNLR